MPCIKQPVWRKAVTQCCCRRPVPVSICSATMNIALKCSCKRCKSWKRRAHGIASTHKEYTKGRQFAANLRLGEIDTADGYPGVAPPPFRSTRKEYAAGYPGVAPPPFRSQNAHPPAASAIRRIADLGIDRAARTRFGNGVFRLNRDGRGQQIYRLSTGILL